jgi:hypothetical protein
VLALSAMLASYRPTVSFYGLSRVWLPTLPLAGVLFLFMTWRSALNYWRGYKARWKDRTYAAD